VAQIGEIIMLSVDRIDDTVSEAWMAALYEIRQSLDRAERLLQREEEAASTVVQPLTWQRLEERLARLELGLRRAEQTTAQVDASLQAVTDDLQRWLQTAHAASQKLARACRRSV
jgi:hypothetical protein